MIRRLSAILSRLALIGLTLVETAFAQPRDRPAAEALFREGRQALLQADYAAACAKFRESDRLEQAPGTWLNLGLCEEKLGHWLAALELYQRVIDTLEPGDGRAHAARDQLDALEPRLPRIVLRLSPDAPATTSVSHGGRQYPAASFGASIPLDAGEHVFIAEAPGFAPLEHRLTLAEGQRVELIVAPGASLQPAIDRPEPAAVRKVPPPLPDRRARLQIASPTRSKTLGWAALGIGGGALALSAVGGALVLHNKSIVESECNSSDHACDSKRGVEAASAGATWSTVSTAAFVVGVVGAGAGIYLLLHHGSDGSSTRLHTAPRRGGAVLAVAHGF